jgi:predicted ATPase
VLDKRGTLEHQAAVIHDICTVGPKAGIGVALGILESPKQHESVVEHLFQDTFEVLHCDRVIGRNNTQAIEFTHNTFLATAPTAPPANATSQERNQYRDKLNKYCDELQLTAGMRKKAQNAGIRRREILYADDTQESLTFE